MHISDGEAAIARKPTWCFWSTGESIRNDVLSVTAIIETILVVPLYRWIAAQFGVIGPLSISAVIAPFVLLRSEESTVLGLRWFLRLEKNLLGEDPDYEEMLSVRFVYWMFIIFLVLLTAVTFILCWITAGYYFPFVPIFLRVIFLIGSLPLLLSVSLLLEIFVFSIGVRVASTLAHLRLGVEAMPENFRRLILCTSPAQIPEFVPGINKSSSEFRIGRVLKWADWKEPLDIFGFITWAVWTIILLVVVFICYAPAWFYRLTIKSTVWFWWPLAFLAGDLQKARNPALLKWGVITDLIKC